MTEIFGNSVNTRVFLHGFICQRQGFSYAPQISFRSGNFLSVHKSNTWCMHELKIVFLSPLKTPQLSSIVRSSRVDDSLVVLNMIIKDKSALVYEEDVEDEFAYPEEIYENSELVRKSPAWGDLAFHEDSNCEPIGVKEPKSYSRDIVDMTKRRLYFLEETDENVLSKRILLLSRKNKVRSALELFRSMEVMGFQPSSHSCNSLLACLFRNGLLDYGLTVFEFMKSKKLSSGHTYSLVLKAVASSEGCDSALQRFTEWGQDCQVKKEFDTIAYNTILSICGKVNNWGESERIWRLMEVNGCSPTRITYCLLITTFVNSSQNELALDVYREMVRNHFEPGNDTMQAVIGACTQEGKWEVALSVFQDMLKRKLRPNLTACNALMNALGKAGKVELAFSCYDIIIKTLGHQPDSYTWNALLCALYKENRYGDAIQLFESIKNEKNFQLNQHLCNTALLSCSKLGLWDRALQILWEMENSEQAMSTSSYNLVISACEIARKPAVALQVYDRMVQKKHTPDTFTHLSLIRCCIWGSLWVELDELLNRAQPDASLYNAVIQGMCLRAQIDAAKKIYAKMREDGIRPDGKTRALMLQSLQKNPSKPNRRWYSHSRN